METVAFYSYKGGVGRTLLVANTAQFLAMAGRRVVALDLDLEAPGLHQKLAGQATLDRAASGELQGTVDALLDTLEGEPRKLSLRQIAVEVDLPAGTGGSLFLIPAGSAPSHAYWAALERLNGSLRSNLRNGGLPEAVLELQARIAEEFAPDLLLIDSRTGITELGGLATSILADRVVCLTTTAPESVEGTRVVADALRKAPRLSSQKPLRIDFLITRVTAGWPHARNVSRVIQELGGSVAVLPHDAGITNEERVLSRWRPVRTAQPGHEDEDNAGKELFSATLEWIAESFPEYIREGLTAGRPVYEMMLTILGKVLGGEHLDTARSLNNFGLFLQNRGDLAAARPYFEQELEIQEKVQGKEHPDTAQSLNNLASLLQSQGDLAAARLYYEQALAIREKVLGAEHPETARSLNNLGILLQSQGDLAAARPYFERALAAQEKILGDEHPDTALSLNNLGSLLRSQGDLAGARLYYERALAIREKVLGADHPDTARALNNLGILLQSQGDLAAARPYFERALATQEKVLGAEHPDTAIGLNNLGILLQSQGDPAGARPYYERAAAIFESRLGPNHPVTKTARENLAALKVLEEQG